MGILAVVAVIVVLLVFVVLFSVDSAKKCRDQMLFAPTKVEVYRPGGTVTNFFLQLGKEQIHCQHVVNTTEKDVLLYLHGTNNNLSCRKYVVDMANSLKLDLLLVDYPGYGHSSGTPSIRSMEKCGVVAVDFLQEIGYDPKKIRVWTESIGSVAGSTIARDRKVHSVVVLFGLSSFNEIIEDLDIFGKSLLVKISNIMLPQEKNSCRYKKTMNKLIFLHSRDDEVIPYSSVENMVSNIPEKYSGGLITIQGKHSSPLIQPDQFEKVLHFMDVKCPPMDTMQKWTSSFSTLAKGLEFRILDT